MTGQAILITGGSGLLGLHWAAACREKNLVTLGLHRRTVQLAGTAALALDLTDPRALDAALTVRRIACVIHTAGLTNVELCEQNPDAAEHQNVKLAAGVAAAAERAGAALIHISTDHLFDGRADIYDEDSPVAPVNVYGRTKARAEEAVLRAHSRALILRTNFYGWGPTYRHSFSDWLVKGLRQNLPLRLFTDMRYTPTHISPLIDTAMSLSARGVTGVLNVVGEDVLSKHSFGLRLAEIFGLSSARIEPVRLTDQPNLVHRPISMALSTHRLKSFLGHGLGGLDEHLELLRAQESNRAITEIRSL